MSVLRGGRYGGVPPLSPKDLKDFDFDFDFDFKDFDFYEQFCGLKKHQDEEPIDTITALDLKKRLDGGDKIQFIYIRLNAWARDVDKSMPVY